MAPAQVEWLTKEEAAARLKVSARRVLEFAQAGLLKSARQRDPQSNQMCTRIHAGDVERLVDEREREASEPRERPAPQALQQNKTAGPAIPANTANALVARLLNTTPAAPLRPWLTLEEADAYSGLPATFLVRLIQGGTLPALDVGPRKGGHWRVKRSDLDGIQGEYLSAQTANA